MSESPEKLKEEAGKYLKETLNLMQNGHNKEALESLRKAEKAAQQVKANDILIHTMNIRGQLMLISGELESARNIYTLALKTCTTHLERNPENVSYQSCFGTTNNNLGNLLKSMGRIEEARSRYEKALEIYEKIQKDYPENVEYESDVAMTLNNLGNLLSYIGRFEEAKNRYENALEIYDKIIKNGVKNVTYQSYIGTTLNNLGNLLYYMGHVEEQKERYERALEIYEELLKNDPENVEYKSDVAMTLNNLGILHSDTGCFDEAVSKYKRALEIYEKLLKNDSKNVIYQSYIGSALNNLGKLLTNKDELEEAKKRQEQSLEIRKEILESKPENVVYQSDVGETLNDLGTSLCKLGQFEDAKEKYKQALKIREELLETDSENVVYRSNVGETLNNLGSLLFDMEIINEAKERYLQSLEICSESMEFLIVGKKAQAIIGVISSLLKLAEVETNSHKQIDFLREGIHVCKQNRDFFKKNDLKHEGNLALGAGLRVYLDYLMINIGGERNPDKRTEEYEKSIIAVEKLEAIENEEKNKVLLESALCYLRGRKFVNESLRSENPNIDLIRKASEQFKKAKEAYEKATVCYCIYTGILEVESIKDLEKESDKKIQSVGKVVEELQKEIPTPANSRVIATFEEIISILENKESRSEEEIRNRLNDQIMKIDSFAVRNIFDHVGKKLSQKLTECLKEPFSPHIEYGNWKLHVKFTDPEKVKGILTIEAGGKKIFDEPLGGRKELPIHYIPMKKEEKITFKITGQEKSVTRHIEYCEDLEPDRKVYILEHDCREDILINSKILNIAVVQLKYEIVRDGRVIKLTVDKSLGKKKSGNLLGDENEIFSKERKAYWKKVQYILNAVKDKAKIVVFPEFSIPFEFLPEIQKYVDENRIIVVAGSHYVTEENLEEYKDLFMSEIGSKDLRKNICPVLIPLSKIVHTEKLLPAWVERKFLSTEGMNKGELKHIFKIADKLNLGILVCFEYLDKLRIRFIETCDILLIPQTNPNTERFYQVALEDLNNPQYPGNKAYVMANGIFPFEGKTSGGFSGVLLTLDKHSHKEQIKKAIKKPINEVYEEFVLLASINTEYNPARDIAQGQVAISSCWMPIIEEKEILDRAKAFTEKKASSIVDAHEEDLEIQRKLIEKENKKNNDEAQKFIEILRKIVKCEGEGLKYLLESNASIIEKYSPLMYEENAKDLKNLAPEEVKEKCCPVFIPINT